MTFFSHSSFSVHVLPDSFGWFRPPISLYAGDMTFSTASTGPLWGFKIRAVFFQSCVIFDTL